MNKEILLSVAMMFCNTLAILAQPNAEDSVMTKALEEIIIQGIRAQPTDPVTQTTIDFQAIEKSYIGQDASVVLENLSPSIISYSDAGAPIGNYTQFRMRGIDQTRINVTLNGAPLNDMIDQGVFFSNFSDFANSVQSIQVQRGVGGSSNGTASYGGSVNFESTRLNQEGPGFGLQLLGGSFDTYRISGELSTGKLSNNMAFYSRITRTLSNGYKTHSGSDSYSLFFSGGYIGEREVLKITAFAGKTQNDQSYLPVLLSDIENDPKTNYNSANDTDDFEQELVQLQYSRILNDDLTFNSTLYYGGARGVFPFGLNATTQLLFGLTNNHYGFFTDVNYESSKLTFTAGMHGYLFRRTNDFSVAPNTSQPDYQDTTNKDELSFFSKVGYDFGALKILGDVQLRYVHLKFESPSLESLANVASSSRNWLFINPKLGLNYSISSRSSLYTFFGITSREPTRTDILQGDGSSINSFNIDSVLDEDLVKSERVDDLEIGYRFAGKKFSATINYFLMHFKNEISQVGALAANSYVPLRQNVAKSRRSGVEIEGRWVQSEVLKFSLLASYLTTNINEFVNANADVLRDVEHIFAPRWNINPSIWLSPNKTFAFSLSGRYVSESFMELSNNKNYALPDYFILNSQMDINFSESIKFSLVLNNLLDELYFTDGAPVDIDFDGNVDGPGYRVQPPRHFYAILKMNF